LNTKIVVLEVTVELNISPDDLTLNIGEYILVMSSIAVEFEDFRPMHCLIINCLC